MHSHVKAGEAGAASAERLQSLASLEPRDRGGGGYGKNDGHLAKIAACDFSGRRK
jgi:hypothetical protein